MPNPNYKYWLITVTFDQPAPNERNRELLFATMTYTNALTEDLERGGSSHIRFASSGAHDIESLVRSDADQAHRLLVQAVFERFIGRQYPERAKHGFSTRIEPHEHFTSETAPDPVEILGGIPI